MAIQATTAIKMTKATMKRLKGFDYKRPYFYMVTLKRRKGLRPFCEITKAKEPPKDAKGRPRYLIANELTEAFARVIREFHTKWWGLWPIECFIIMPDHLHLLIHIKDTGDQMALGKYVYQLMKALAVEYWRLTGQGGCGRTGPGGCGRTGPATQNSYQSGVLPAPSGNIPQPAPSGNIPQPAPSGNIPQPAPSGNIPQSAPSGNTFQPAPSGNNAKLAPIFERDWHDWIVKKDGQLAAFTRYIRENPERAWLRQQNRQYFGTVRKVSFLGREWFAYGNLAILELPVLKAVKGHRATKPGSPEWQALVDECARIGPGGAGVGTFMSPLEKECGNAIAAAGGKWVVLSPEGFHERWHPGRQYEKFCAEGRMLFLSLYPVMDRQPTKQELYHRCHEMGDIAVAGLGNAGEN